MALIFQVLSACGQRIKVAHLIRRVQIAVRRAQGERDGVMIGGRLAAVTADETHRRSAVALAGVEQKVANDHAELVQVPVQRFAIFRPLQDDMS